MRLRALLRKLVGSLWFVPSVAVLGAILLAIALIELDTRIDVPLGGLWPRLFGASPEGARGMLTAIAGSTITVAGVVFSVTIVALSLAASQYSPRVLRSFTSDRPTQVVLGVFVGVFAYCLVVLRTIRSNDGAHFVPSLAVFGGLILALVGIGFFVYFIHHMAESIQASSILLRIAAATQTAIDRLFPDELGSSAEAGKTPDRLASDEAVVVLARKTGYIASVDGDSLMRVARECQRVVRMRAAIGDFVIQGQPLLLVEGNEKLAERHQKTLNSSYYFDAQRTIDQDVSYGVQQIVDMGCKALSPGINDASTALLCIDRLTELLVRLARRCIETPMRFEDGELRVIARGATFESLVQLAYHSLRNNARDQGLVLLHLLSSLEQVAAATSSIPRRRLLEKEVRQIADLVNGLKEPPLEREVILDRVALLSAKLSRATAEPCGVRASQTHGSGAD